MKYAKDKFNFWRGWKVNTLRINIGSCAGIGHWPVAVQWLARLCQCQCSSVSPLWWQCMCELGQGVFTLRYIFSCSHQNILAPSHWLWRCILETVFHKHSISSDEIIIIKKENVSSCKSSFSSRKNYIFTWMDSLKGKRYKCNLPISDSQKRKYEGAFKCLFVDNLMLSSDFWKKYFARAEQTKPVFTGLKIQIYMSFLYSNLFDL